MHEGVNGTECLWAEERLLQLGLTAVDLQAMRRQGFIAAEYRTRIGRRWGPYFKLRWREPDGRQRVHYLGADVTVVDEIQTALARWQQSARLQQEIDRLLKDTRRALRSLRESISPHITSEDQRWHGYELRQSRNTQSPRHPDGTTRLKPTMTSFNKKES